MRRHQRSPAGAVPCPRGRQAATRQRITGTAAEMSFYAVLGLVPLTVAFGLPSATSRGSSGRRASRRANGPPSSSHQFIGPELTVDTVAPDVRTQLAQERGGLALGSLLIVAWLGSRMFTTALYALDVAHEVEDTRSAARQRLVGLGLAVASLLASVLTLMIMIVGPLLGHGQTAADRLGHVTTYRLVWVVGRWPLLLVTLVGFLVVLYRFAPSCRPA